MACNTCNTPASSGGNLPAPKKAYLTDPATSPAERCGSAPVDPCSPQTSKRRYLSDYIPGWLQRLTPAPMGRLLIGVGSVLHYFKGRNAGPLFFDGENVTVGAQPTLAAAANPESVHERGHLTLARKVRRPQVMPDGTVADLDFYEFGVQALGEIDQGHLAGLTIDRTSGQARIDAVKPVEVDMVKRGMPCKFRRLGYATEEIDGGCGKVDVEKFYGYRGAVYGDDEIAKDQLGGIPAVLVPVQSECGDVHYRIATPKDGFVPNAFAVGEANTEQGIEDEYAAIVHAAVRWTDSDGDPRVSYKDTVNGWYHPVEKYVDEELIYTNTKLSGTSYSESIDETLTLPDTVPNDASYVILSVGAATTSSAPGSGTNTARCSYVILKRSDNGAENRLSSGYSTASSPSSGADDRMDSAAMARVPMGIHGGSPTLKAKVSLVAGGSGGGLSSDIKVYLQGWGRT